MQPPLTDPTQTARTATEHDRYAGQLLRILRRKKRISQTELARMSGVSFQQVQKYEKGRNRISVGRLIVMCQALKISPSRFILQIEEKAEASENEAD